MLPLLAPSPYAELPGKLPLMAGALLSVRAGPPALVAWRTWIARHDLVSSSGDL